LFALTLVVFVHVVVLKTSNNILHDLAPPHRNFFKGFWVLENTVAGAEQEGRGVSPKVSQKRGVHWPGYAITPSTPRSVSVTVY
jgi:hypothetical protein